jgi:hypothetical protein
MIGVVPTDEGRAQDEWTGIADADAHLGRPFPLPTVPLPLTRWVDVRPAGAGVEVAWNLDDTRPGSPGRLALYAGTAPPPEPAWDAPVADVDVGGADAEHRTLALAEADASLRPAHELRWRAGDLHLRLIGQGPWELGTLVSVARSVAP